MTEQGALYLATMRAVRPVPVKAMMRGAPSLSAALTALLARAST